jgi:signal transduction histidine kinase
MPTLRAPSLAPVELPAGFGEAYARETRDLLIARLRLGLKVGIVLYFLFIGLDILVAGDLWPRIAAVRLGSIGFGLAGLWLAYRPWGGRHVKLLSVAIMTIGAGGISLMTALWEGFQSQYYVGNMLAIFLVGLYFPWGAVTTAGYGVLVLTTYLGLNVTLHDQGMVVAAMPLFFLSGTVALTAWAAGAVDRTRRESLVMRMQLVVANGELKSLDEAKTKFFSGVSHELRTPLMLILGPLERMIDGKVTDSRPLLQAMSTNANRLLREVNQLLNFSRIDAGKAQVNREAGDLGEMLRRIVAAARPYAETRHMQLESAGLEDLPVFAFDIEKIETAAYNLFSNAIKFTPDGGTVTVRAGTEGEKVWFEVQDTGCGIPQDQQGKLFQRFAQVDGGRNGKVQGTGLGLAMVKEYAEMHGGSVALRSTPGEGSTFRVELPNLELATLQQADTAQVPAKRPASSATAFAELAQPSLEETTTAGTDSPPEADPTLAAAPDAPRLLLVEDNPDMRAFVASCLAPRWRVQTAKNGREGLETARRIRPDLIVSDVMMPELDGFQMVEELRKDHSFASTPIIFLTARTGAEAVVRGLTLGAVDYVNKPFRQAELEARVEAQLRLRAAERTLAERDSRLLAMGQMTGTIAHDMRSPLATAIARLEILRMTAEMTGTTAQMQDEVEVLERSLHRIENMVQEMLEFVRGSEMHLDLQTVCAANFFAAIGEEAQATFAPTKVTVTAERRGDPDAALQLDGARMRRVVENLLNNGRDALLQQTTGHPDPRIRLVVSANAREVRVTISDNGPGIPDEIAANLFQAFATSGKANGTGLGLSIVWNIVKAHKGTVEVQARGDDGGAAFTIVLPRLAAQIVKVETEAD